MVVTPHQWPGRPEEQRSQYGMAIYLWRAQNLILAVILMRVGGTPSDRKGLRLVGNRQFSCVNSHADHGIDPISVQLVDFALCGDPAGGGQAAARGPADSQNGWNVGAPEEALGIDMRVEKIPAVRLRQPHPLARQ